MMKMERDKLKDGIYALMHTEKGDILLELEYKRCPMTVCNFIGLAEGNLNVENGGVPFYDGLNFHRVIKDFMIQGGDVTSKNAPMNKSLGAGDLGYTIPARLTKKFFVQNLRVYFNASNVFTISALSKMGIDPEAPSVNNGYYPQQRVFSMGINLTF